MPWPSLLAFSQPPANREIRQNICAFANDLPNHQLPGVLFIGHAERQSRPTKAYQRWLSQIPNVYQTEILRAPADTTLSIHEDTNRLATLKHYRSLVPMAQEVRKPIFYLKPADGVVGGHYYAVQDAYQDFLGLAKQVTAHISAVS